MIHPDVVLKRDILTSFTMRSEIDRKMSIMKKKIIECKMDNLEFVKDTFYTGEMKCAEDYFALVRHRLEIQFVRAIN